MPRGSETTDRVKKLRSFDLEKLCRTKTYMQIGEMFGVSQGTVGVELQKQIDSRVFYRSTLTNVEQYEEKLTVREFTCGGGYGQWLNSDIRRFGKLMLKENDL